MEIISYVIEGALEHRDSMGHSTIIKPGEIQRMSAGTGVKHSEYNYLKDKQTHFLQIWIVPDKSGYPPSYGQMNFESKLSDSHFILLASQKGRDHSVALNQDVDLYLGKSQLGSNVIHKTSFQRSLWIQMIRGEVTVENQKLEPGDGLALQDYSELHISAKPGSEYLLFDMPTIK
jgi:redox-sensitive bicupin YhaK (pirin superfamily)